MEIEAIDDITFFSEQSFFDKSVEETLATTLEMKQPIMIPNCTSQEQKEKADSFYNENNDNLQVIIDIDTLPEIAEQTKIEGNTFENQLSKYRLSFFSNNKKIEKQKDKIIRVGQQYQAIIPDLEPNKNDESTDIGENSSKNYFVSKQTNKNEYDLILLHDPSKFSEIDYEKFKENLKRILLIKKNEKKNRFGDEKLLYLLNVFKYDYRRCLDYVKAHPKSWKHFLSNIKV